MRTHFRRYENANKIHQNIWDTGKAVLRRKHIAMNKYIKKEGRCKVSNQQETLCKWKKEEKLSPKHWKKINIK